MVLKRYLPRSLFGRAFLMVALPVILLQGVVAYVFIQRHYEGVTRQMAGSLAGELTNVADLVEKSPDRESAAEVLRLMGPTLDMELTLIDANTLDAQAFRRFYDFSGGALADAMRDAISRPLALDLVSREKQVEARLLTSKGVLSALINRRRLAVSNPHQLLVVMVLSAVALVSVSLLFLRNQVRPIRQLAAAAEGFGVGRRVSFRPSGADEVRRAGASFLEMRARIERHLESRTRMLSAISHDLRSPLARMRLALELMEDGEDTAELRRDVVLMERMIDEFLAFVRDESAEESAPVDPISLAAEVVDDLRRSGAEIAFESRGEGEAFLRPGAIRRALSNLADNAARHGRRARVSVELSPRRLDFIVEDDGPGIPREEREAALTPFVRLDQARNQDEGGGVGLGLSIAADIARGHGGRLTLDVSRDLGGLEARISLPRGAGA